MPQKRKNSDTGMDFVRGDFSPDRKSRFWGYRKSNVKKNLDFGERWLTLEKFIEEVSKVAEKQRQSEAQNRSENLQRRKNPETQTLFKSGDVNKKNQYFVGYVRGKKTSDGYCGESWVTREAYLRVRVGNTFSKIKKRAKEQDIPFNLTIDYLLSILPDDMRCPILETEMKFGGGNERLTSPSVDRFVPSKGYVKENISWVSLLANSIKGQRTAAEMRSIADWIEQQEIYQKQSSTLQVVN